MKTLQEMDDNQTRKKSNTLFNLDTTPNIQELNIQALNSQFVPNGKAVLWPAGIWLKATVQTDFPMPRVTSRVALNQSMRPTASSTELSLRRVSLCPLLAIELGIGRSGKCLPAVSSVPCLDSTSRRALGFRLVSLASRRALSPVDPTRVSTNAAPTIAWRPVAVALLRPVVPSPVLLPPVPLTPALRPGVSMSRSFWRGGLVEVSLLSLRHERAEKILDSTPPPLLVPWFEEATAPPSASPCRGGGKAATR